MDIELFIRPFLLAFVGAFFLSLVFVFFPFRVANNRKDARHEKKYHLPRLGGLAIIIAFFLAIFLDQNLVMTKPFWGLMAGAAFIFLFGVADDIFELDWKTQLLFQVGLAVIAFLFSIQIGYVTNPFGGVIDFNQMMSIGAPFLVTLCWLLLVMNAVNWLDGADGLLGSVGSIAAIVIFFISLRPEVYQPPIALLAAALLGAILGFLIFNMPPARILAGTTGSMFIGFTLAVLAIIAGSKIATTLLVLALPVVDAVLVAFWRLFSGDSVFHPDERHMHFRLLALGWSPLRVFLSITVFTATIGGVALFIPTFFKVVLFAVIAGCFIGFLLWLEYASKSKSNESAGH